MRVIEKLYQKFKYVVGGRGIKETDWRERYYSVIYIITNGLIVDCSRLTEIGDIYKKAALLYIYKLLANG